MKVRRRFVRFSADSGVDSVSSTIPGALLAGAASAPPHPVLRGGACPPNPRVELSLAAFWDAERIIDPHFPGDASAFRAKSFDPRAARISPDYRMHAEARGGGRVSRVSGARRPVTEFPS
jgi:hypothetical protein